jgi:hypothetical protein
MIVSNMRFEGDTLSGGAIKALDRLQEVRLVGNPRRHDVQLVHFYVNTVSSDTPIPWYLRQVMETVGRCLRSRM